MAANWNPIPIVFTKVVIEPGTGEGTIPAASSPRFWLPGQIDFVRRSAGARLSDFAGEAFLGIVIEDRIFTLADDVISWSIKSRMDHHQRAGTEYAASKFEFLHACNVRMRFEPVEFDDGGDAVRRHADDISAMDSGSRVGSSNHLDAEMVCQFCRKPLPIFLGRTIDPDFLQIPDGCYGNGLATRLPSGAEERVGRCILWRHVLHPERICTRYAQTLHHAVGHDRQWFPRPCAEEQDETNPFSTGACRLLVLAKSPQA